MTRRDSFLLHSHRNPFHLAAALAVLVLPASGQSTATAAQGAAATAPVYAVISIRPHRITSNGSSWGSPTADGYEAINYPVRRLIEQAYEIRSPGQLVGLPDWAGWEETFDIEAKLDDDAVAKYQKLSDRERIELAAPMLRSMLANRFNLKVHHETRELPVYELVIAKGGFKLQPSKEPENLGGMVTNRGGIYIRGGPIGARFIVGLSDATGRIVIDKTGLTGCYDIDFKWTPDEDTAAGVSGPSLFTALEEQLGLKLVPAKAPVDVLVVDHVEMPSEN
jgi:uncharacterized protein (TIGR03435 family)